MANEGNDQGKAKGDIAFLVIYSRKLEKCNDFYSAVLGKPLIREQYDHGPVHYSFPLGNLGNAVIEFYPTSGTPTLLRIGITVDSLEETVARLGERYFSKNYSDRNAYASKKIIISDPEKRLVEIEERKQNNSQQSKTEFSES